MNESVESEALVMPKQNGLALRRPSASVDYALVLSPELELVHHFFRQKLGVADIFDLHPSHHLANDDLQVLVVDVDALQPVDLLDFVDQVFLQLLFAEHVQDVVRVARSVHQRLAGLHALAFLHVDVHAARQRIFALLAVVAHHVDLALPLGHLAVLHGAVDLGDDRGFARLARFKQLHHARQTAGDVLGLGSFARDLRQHVAGMRFFAVTHHQVGVGGHQVLLGIAASLPGVRPDNDHRLPFFIRRIRNHQLRHAGDFVHLLPHA